MNAARQIQDSKLLHATKYVYVQCTSMYSIFFVTLEASEKTSCENLICNNISRIPNISLCLSYFVSLVLHASLIDLSEGKGKRSKLMN